MSHFIVADRKTAYLLPPSVDDWLAQDHLARFVVEVIDGLDLSGLTRKYAGRGSKAHHPATLLVLLVYGYATGVFSSRKIEQATYDSVAFRYIAAGTHPDHDTLATFGRRFLDELAELFVQVLEVAHEMKLLRMGTVCQLQLQLQFGIIKSVMGFRQFSLRDLRKVTGESTLVCLAWNVKRMAVLRLKTG